MPVSSLRVDGPVSEHEDEEPKKSGKPKKAPVELGLDEYNRPILPDFDDGAKLSLDAQKDTVRAFLNGHYRMGFVYQMTKYLYSPRS